MKLFAEMMQDVSGYDMSFLGMLAHALGHATNGNIDNQIVDMGNGDMTIATLQALYLDSGDKRIVCGTSQSSDGRSFVILDDGKVEIVEVAIEDGFVAAESRPVVEDDYSNCIAYMTASDIFSGLCMNVLQKMDVTVDGDEISGNMKVSIGDAINNRIVGSQKVVIRRDGKLVAGFKQTLDADSGVTMLQAEKLIKTEALTPSEIEAERKHFIDLVGESNVFNQKVGLA